jgi:ABC-type nitrate/sulfonate/bicarbonate transport system permease component
MATLSASQRLAISTASVLGAMLLWEGASRLPGDPELLPSPISVVPAFLAMLGSGELYVAVRDSMARVAAGYAIGTLAGIITGLLLGRIALLNASVGILFDFLKGIPPIALVPLVIIWFGIGEISKYIIIAYIVWVVVAISTAVGAREIPKVRLRAAAVFGLSPVATFWRIILPSSLIYIVAGMRSAIGFAFVALVSAELIGANTGIGQIVMDARFSLQTDKMIVGLLVLGLLGSLIQVAFDLAAARLNLSMRFQ